MLNVLVIGDVTSPAGIEHLRNNLWRIRKENAVDLCVVNGENAAFITGISSELADTLLRSGADVITGGNHTMRNRSVFTYLDDVREILRPINFGPAVSGHGYTVAEARGYRILVINAMGNIHIDPVLDSPYPYIDRVLCEERGNYDFAVLDIHAEATGEKLAMGYAYDGKINIVFGTHTHVPTADMKILPNGTGYVSDVGMCGETGGVLGMDPAVVIERMRTRLSHKFKTADGPPAADGVIFSIDTATGRVTDIKRISF